MALILEVLCSLLGSWTFHERNAREREREKAPIRFRLIFFYLSLHCFLCLENELSTVFSVSSRRFFINLSIANIIVCRSLKATLAEINK